MKYSAFAKYGFLRFTSKRSVHEAVYTSMMASLDGGSSNSYDMTPGTHEEASVFCRAEAIARTAGVLERAGNQHDPAKVLEMIAVMEQDYRIQPPANATIQDRRNVLVLRSKANRGSRRENVEDQLRQALGDDFLFYRVVTESESDLWPASPGAGPGVYSRATIPTKFLQVVLGNTLTGSADWVSYKNLDESQGPIYLAAGDVICVNAGDLENAERVTVLDTRTDILGNREFQATFTLFHGFGFAITNGPFPAQFSTRRFAFIIVKPACSVDPVKRAKVDEVMARVARGVSEWGIVHFSTAPIFGPFTIDVTPIGTMPMGTFAL